MMDAHLTLGELIALLSKEPEDTHVRCGFGGACSYRGDYSEVAFRPVANTTIGKMLAEAQRAVDSTYTGWKGGDNTMSAGTPAWLAEEGRGGMAMTDDLVVCMIRNILWQEVASPKEAADLPTSLLALARSFGAALDCEPFAYELENVLELVTQWCDANFWRIKITRRLTSTWCVELDNGDEWEQIGVEGACLRVALMRACVLAVAENVKG